MQPLPPVPELPECSHNDARVDAADEICELTINISFSLEYTEQYYVNKSKLADQPHLIGAADNSV